MIFVIFLTLACSLWLREAWIELNAIREARKFRRYLKSAKWMS